MLKLSKLDFKLDFVLKALVFLILINLFFPIRHVFFTKEAYLTGQYSDFTSFSLYLSDILIFTTWFLVIMSRGRGFYHVARPEPKPDEDNQAYKNSHKNGENQHTSGLFSFWYGVKPLKWLILAVFIVFIVHFAHDTRLTAYLSLKLLELIVAYGTLVVVIKEFSLKELILKLFASLASIQALIALIQFGKQSPLGLFKIGEYHIGPAILGVAKIVSSGTTYIRGYGTFPHPNPLSAFLVAGIFVVLYLLVTSASLKWKTIYSGLLLLNILGLTVTFSRGAFLALTLGLIIFFVCLFYVIARKSASDDEAISKKRKIASAALAMTAISIVISFFIFKPFLLTRATFSDQSTIDRKFYNAAGIKMAFHNPVFGLGLGESVLHMEQYSNKNLAPWDKQPPHNYFILAAAEMGILAMLILIWIFLNHLWPLIHRLKSEQSFEVITRHLLLVTILIAFLTLMLFDHYFYTLEQTKLLLWFVLALIAVETCPPKIDNKKTLV